MPLAPTRVLVAGRGARMLRAAGQVADDALLWAVPVSELPRTVDLVHQGSAGRRPELPGVNIIWAPLVERGKATGALVRRAAAYAVLNNSGETRERWGVGDDLVAGSASSSWQAKPMRPTGSSPTRWGQTCRHRGTSPPRQAWPGRSERTG